MLARFQPIFSPAHLPELTEIEFRSFLPLSSNKHWSGLQRLGPRMCADMDTLRSSLLVLLDENRPIEDRYDYALSQVVGLGRAVATAILLIMYPDKYGVWNTTSEAALKILDLWPRFERGESEGKRYVKINNILNRLSRELGVDLWMLDALWYYLLVDTDSLPPTVIEDEESPVSISIEGTAAERIVDPESESQLFGLERHLHEFLRDNWDRTELGRSWALYREPGNDQAGYEYTCRVGPNKLGRIDLLAHHRHEPKWLIVELKRNQTGDETLGQVMRYMGWIKRHLAEPNEEIRGLIIAHETDDTLVYAVSMVPTVDLYRYKVRFQLEAVPEPGS